VRLGFGPNGVARDYLLVVRSTGHQEVVEGNFCSVASFLQGGNMKASKYAHVPYTQWLSPEMHEGQTRGSPATRRL
jgi:hypothetical protein